MCVTTGLLNPVPGGIHGGKKITGSLEQLYKQRMGFLVFVDIFFEF